MRKFVVTVIASGAAVLAAGLAPAPVTAAPFPASAIMKDEALARGTVILAGPRYLYGSRYYPPYYGDRPYYRRYNNGYRPYYPAHYGYRPYYAPLSICGTLLCYRPKYFIAPAW